MELNEIMAAQRSEAQLMKQVLDGLSGSQTASAGWEGFEVEFMKQVKEIQEGFERDQRRSEMKFDRKTLVLAQRARRAKKRAHLARKYRVVMEKWRSSKAQKDG